MRMMSALLVALFVFLAPSEASAQRMGIDANIRGHVGLSVVNGPGPVGLNLGVDSRLGRLVFVDFGGFISQGYPLQETDGAATPGQDFHLRHGITLTPGVRIPHRQPEAFRWDVLLRAGPSVVWSVYDGPRARGIVGQIWVVDPALVAGPEFQLMRGSFGLRVTARVFVARPYSQRPDQRGDVWAILPQAMVEGSYKFQGVIREKWREFTKGR